MLFIWSFSQAKEGKIFNKENRIYETLLDSKEIAQLIQPFPQECLRFKRFRTFLNTRAGHHRKIGPFQRF